MLTITSREAHARALTLPLPLPLKALLTRRSDQLGSDLDLAEMARFVIVQPGDDMAALEAELGFSPFDNPINGTSYGNPEFEPGWEWLLDHGHCFEMVFVFSDAGFAEVLFIEHTPQQDARLLALCLAYADTGTTYFGDRA